MGAINTVFERIFGHQMDELKIKKPGKSIKFIRESSTLLFSASLDNGLTTEISMY